jgi:hypothetical protein
MLEYWDTQAQDKSSGEQFRLALMAAGRLAPSEAFPEYFPEPEDEVAGMARDDSEIDFDYSAVQWEAPSEDGANEYERVMSALNQFKTITTRDPDANTEEVTAEFSAEPDDPEWF